MFSCAHSAALAERASAGAETGRQRIGGTGNGENSPGLHQGAENAKGRDCFMTHDEMDRDSGSGKHDELSAPGELDPMFERLSAYLDPTEALRVYELGTADERRRIAPLVRLKISGTTAGDWSDEDRRKIRAWFGIHLLPGPGPVDESAAERAR